MLELCPIHVAGSKFVKTASIEITVINKLYLIIVNCRKGTCDGDEDTDEEQDLEADDGDGNDEAEEALSLFMKKKKG